MDKKRGEEKIRKEESARLTSDEENLFTVSVSLSNIKRFVLCASYSSELTLHFDDETPRTCVCVRCSGQDKVQDAIQKARNSVFLTPVQNTERERECSIGSCLGTCQWVCWEVCQWVCWWACQCSDRRRSPKITSESDAHTDHHLNSCSCGCTNLWTLNRKVMLDGVCVCVGDVIYNWNMLLLH